MQKDIIRVPKWGCIAYTQWMHNIRGSSRRMIPRSTESWPLLHSTALPASYCQIFTARFMTGRAHQNEFMLYITIPIIGQCLRCETNHALYIYAP